MEVIKLKRGHQGGHYPNMAGVLINRENLDIDVKKYRENTR